MSKVHAYAAFVSSVALAFASASAFADPAAPTAQVGNWITTASGCKVWNPQPEPNETVEWTGACVDGYAEGQGSLLWKKNGIDTSKVVGLSSRGIMIGHVQQTFPNGDQYIGNMFGGERSGIGQYLFGDGSKYAGRFAHGFPNGLGEAENIDGMRYTGQFQNGKRHGQGIWITSKGKYIGQFKDGNPDGSGTATYRDEPYGGGEYVGHWKDGRWEGYGVKTWKDGSYYAGEWKDGLPDGFGTLVDSNGRYTGDLKAYKREGRGILIYPDGSRYIGTFVNDKVDGEGSATFKDGSSYVGKYSHDQREGAGTFTFPDGSYLIGNWHISKLEGSGNHYFVSGQHYEGNFKDSLENGMGVLYDLDGQLIKQGFWQNGTYVGPVDPAILAARSGVNAHGRIALLIANNDYPGIGLLANPVNDADLVAASLRSAGFTVLTVKNGPLAQLRKTLFDFRLKAAGAEVAVVYYAGHGVEIGNEDFLVPVDAKVDTAQNTVEQSLGVDRVLEAASGAKMRLVILDACRDNPFAESWELKKMPLPSTLAMTRSLTATPASPKNVEAVVQDETPKRSNAGGLAALQADDFMILFSAAPGKTALDGSGQNSPFARSIAQRLLDPNMKIQDLGGLVRDDVLSATNGLQRPYVNSSVTGVPFYLFK